MLADLVSALLSQPANAPFRAAVRALPFDPTYAADSSTVTSAYHLMVRLEDRWSREIVARADGTRTQSQLISELDALAAACDPSEADVWRSVRAGLPGILGRLAQQGLMIA